MFNFTAENFSHPSQAAILLLLMPALFFEPAIKTQSFLVTRQSGQIAMLAVIAPVMRVLIVCFGFSTLLGFVSEFSWSQCFALACVICVTDAAAANALLVNLKSPMRYRTLLIGDNLFGSSVCLVLYTVATNYTNNPTASLFSSVLYVLWQIGGGVALAGLAFFVTIFALRVLVRRESVTAQMTVVACFATFLVADTLLHVSAPLAASLLGLLLADYYPTRIGPKGRALVRVLWPGIRSAAEAFSCVAAGAVIGATTWTGEIDSIGLTDLLLLVPLVTITITARYLVLKVLRPTLSSLGPHVDRADVLVLTYGEQPGGMTLAAALFAFADPAAP